MTTTFEALRQKLAPMIGKDEGRAETTTGAGDDTSVIATALANKPADWYNEWWCIITSGTRNDEYKQISDYDGTSDLTLYSALTGAPGSGVTFELYKYPLTMYLAALNAAALECYPWLYDPIMDDTLVSNNWLPDGNMEKWSSATAMSFWDVVGSGASVARSTTKLFGTYAAALTRVTNDCYLSCDHANWPRLLDLEGLHVHLYCWVKCDTADTARIAIYDGITTTYSDDYHAGDDEWELMEVEATLADDCRTVEVRLYINDNDATVYFDNARLIGPRLYEYLLPTDFVDAPLEVYLQGSEVNVDGDAGPYDCDKIGLRGPLTPIHGWEMVDDGTYRWIRFAEGFTNNKKIVLRGKKAFTAATLWTETVSVEAPKTVILCDYAAFWMFRSLADEAGEGDTGRYRQLSQEWYNTYVRDRQQFLRQGATPKIKVEYRA